MTSISGKNNIDWKAFADSLHPVSVLDEPVLVKKRSRDFFWYSPILNEQLKRCFGDLVALPASVDELKICLAAAYKADAPVVLRGGGTGNYGQAVPVDGGLILETTKMNRILEIGDGFVRAESGALMADINSALKDNGQEMAMFPSTQDIATIGGFVAGGSSGIGSLANGALREPGNLIELRALSVEAAPQEHVFNGDDVLKIHHAWGLNGAITDVTIRAVPSRDWIACMATFKNYKAAYSAGYAVASSNIIAPKLASVVDARIVDFFPGLNGHITMGHDLLVCYIPSGDLNAFRNIIEEADGQLELTLTEKERLASDIPHAFEFCYNHTTLQVLKTDRSATYQQVGVPDASDAQTITRLREALGREVWSHHEFFRLHGEVRSVDLPIIWFRGKEHLEEINSIYSSMGFTVYDAHINQIEGGGLHNADYVHLAWKKRLDPKGLLNSAKSSVWQRVKHLNPEEIEAKAAM
ncbi:MAG: FAD-binding oxidoreductase [Pseudomonadota bacterium]